MTPQRLLEQLAGEVVLLRRRVAELELDRSALVRRVDALERTCQNDPPGGQGGSTFDPPGPAEGPVPAAEPPKKNASSFVEWMSFPRDPFPSTVNFPKKISGEE